MESDYQLRHICPSVRPSLRLSAWNNSAPTGRVFMKFDILHFSQICRENSSSIKIGQ